MVCISYPYKTSCLVGKVATPWSSFGEQNRVSLVSFQRAATAQVRLCKRYRRLVARGKNSNVVVTAIAREILAFLWAIAQEVPVTH
jgi:hypothetical protein